MTLYRKRKLDEILQPSLMFLKGSKYIHGDNAFVMKDCMKLVFFSSLAGPYESMYSPDKSSSREAVK